MAERLLGENGEPKPIRVSWATTRAEALRIQEIVQVPGVSSEIVEGEENYRRIGLDPDSVPVSQVYISFEVLPGNQHTELMAAITQALNTK